MGTVALSWPPSLGVDETLTDTLAAGSTAAWCFTVPTPPPSSPWILDLLGFALSWANGSASQCPSPPSPCALNVSAHASTCGISGVPAGAPLGSSSAAVVCGAGGALTLVGADGAPVVDAATGVPALRLPPIALAPGSSYCLAVRASCALSMSQSARSRVYASPRGGFTAGPWVSSQSDGQWGALGARDAPTWGLSASLLRVCGGASDAPSLPSPPPLPASVWGASPSPGPSGVGAPLAILTPLAPVAAPASGGSVPDVFVASDERHAEGLLACLVWLDTLSAVRPYRVRVVPLAARAEDAALLAFPRRASSGGDGVGGSDSSSCPAPPATPTHVSVVVSASRIRRRNGVGGDAIYYNVTHTKFVDVPLPVSDADAVVVSIDALSDGAAPPPLGGTWPPDAMSGGDGWCVGVGPAPGHTLRLAVADAPAGEWGPAACDSTHFSCYGVAGYSGAPPTRLERATSAPWMALDVAQVPLVAPSPSAHPAAAPEGPAGPLTAAAAAVLAFLVVVACGTRLCGGQPLWRRWACRGAPSAFVAVAAAEAPEETAPLAEAEVELTQQRRGAWPTDQPQPLASNDSEGGALPQPVGGDGGPLLPGPLA